MKRLITMFLMLPAIAGADIFSNVMKKAQDVIEQKAASTQQIFKQPEVQTPLNEASGSTKRSASAGQHIDDAQPALTELPLEIKGLTLGMSTEQLDKIYHGLRLSSIRTTPNTMKWVEADHNISLKCTIMGGDVKECKTAFIEDKLVYAQISVENYNKDNRGITRGTLFKELVDALGEKFQSQAIIETETMQGRIIRQKAIWKTPSQDSVVIEDKVHYPDRSSVVAFLTIQLIAGNYESTKKARLEAAQDAHARHKEQQETARKKDL